MPLYNNARQPRTQFSILHRSLLHSDELPFASLVSEERIGKIFAEEEVDFGQTEDAVYTPAATLWGLLSQVFFKEEQRSCAAAVVRIAALWLALGRKVDSTNTGAYCRARKKIPHNVLRRISREIATRAAKRADKVPTDAGIGPASSYGGGRFIMVDGFTVTAADTEENQARPTFGRCPSAESSAERRPGLSDPAWCDADRHADWLATRRRIRGLQWPRNR